MAIGQAWRDGWGVREMCPSEQEPADRAACSSCSPAVSCCPPVLYRLLCTCPLQYPAHLSLAAAHLPCTSSCPPVLLAAAHLSRTSSRPPVRMSAPDLSVAPAASKTAQNVSLCDVSPLGCYTCVQVWGVKEHTALAE